MRAIPALFLAAPLAACATLMQDPDPQAFALAKAIQDEADAHYTALAAMSAPDCDLEHNVQGYDRLDAMAAELQARIAMAKGSTALERAARALSRTLSEARESHRLASAQSSDPAGPCLSAGAITLNRDAIVRASAAIAVSQSNEGVQ